MEIFTVNIILSYRLGEINIGKHSMFEVLFLKIYFNSSFFLGKPFVLYSNMILFEKPAENIFILKKYFDRAIH